MSLVLLFLIIFFPFQTIFFPVRLFAQYENKHKYKEIYQLAEKYTEPEISSVSQGSVFTIYFKEHTINADYMKDLHALSKDIEKFLNDDMYYLDEHGQVVRVDMIVKNKGAPEYPLITNSYPDNSIELNDDRYRLTTYVCGFKTDFEEIAYLSDARSLTIEATINNTDGIERFKDLTYLKIIADEEILKEVREALPDCQVASFP